MNREMKVKQNLYGFVLPFLMIALVFLADLLEGKTSAYVGLLASIPPLSAIFGTVRMVSSIAVLAISAGVIQILMLTSSANRIDIVRILVIAFVSILSVGAAKIRRTNERRMADMMTQMVALDLEAKHAHVDFLTGHPNRLGITHRLNEIKPDVATLVIFDFDKFKEINDDHGHQVGDEFIKNVSRRISSNIKKEDLFGRWGGDEFLAVFLAPVGQAGEVIDRIIQNVCAEPVSIDGLTLPIRVSAGFTSWGKSMSFDEGFKRADQALYQAKERGGCQAVCFDEISMSQSELPHAH